MSGEVKVLRRPPGAVVKVRLTPAAVMACIDAAKAAKVPLEGNISLNSVVRAGVIVMAETLRAGGAIPRRDGFEYLKMIKPFVRGALKGEMGKVGASQKLTVREMRAEAADMQLYGALPIEPPPMTAEEVEASRERTRAALRADGVPEKEIEKKLPRRSAAPPSTIAPRAIVTVDRAAARAKARLAELSLKESADPANLGASEQAELKRLRANRAREVVE